ncbi:hypothetical protein O7628_11250 [Micromonospora sp. WMMD956]|uniref:hypothetical protein n=1 Tax=Micromonospora sp. WMMD956 TaxID=3016108 RepID=UPI002416634F|nr:hypothetical protein [Micromonospora sp. WMMD956]MDG4816078.1 hypothetical protein [Micromonospora sp. WMMD956]
MERVAGKRVRYYCTDFQVRGNGRLDLKDARRWTPDEWLKIGLITLVNVPVEITPIEFEADE